MRHRKKLQKLGLPKDHRISLIRNLITSIVLNGHLKTTKNRAKVLSSRFGRMMNIVQRKDKREAIRLLPQFVTTQIASIKVVDELKKKYEGRTSGYLRMIPMASRKGDNATQVHVELI